LTRNQSRDIIAINIGGTIAMAQLIVRNIDGELVQELKVRAARNGQSAEEEHRQILRRALGANNSGLSLKEMLEQMPDVGDDEDFERSQDRGRAVEL
jgi:plasmid stability protein